MTGRRLVLFLALWPLSAVWLAVAVGQATGVEPPGFTGTPSSSSNKAGPDDDIPASQRTTTVTACVAEFAAPFVSRKHPRSRDASTGLPALLSLANFLTEFQGYDVSLLVAIAE
jgi:hypothetical protein